MNDDYSKRELDMLERQRQLDATIARLSNALEEIRGVARTNGSGVSELASLETVDRIAVKALFP